MEARRVSIGQALSLTFLFFSVPVAASTTVAVDMEGVAPTASLSTEDNTTTSFSGFDLFINHGHFIDSEWSEAGTTRAGNGSDYLGIDSLDPVILTQANGAPFSVISFDATDVYTDSNFIPGLVFEVTGFLNGGGTLSASFTSDSNHAFETFFFGSEWTNLDAVWFLGNDHNAIDNIIVSSTAVPIPAAGWLFGSGLALLLGLNRTGDRRPGH